MLKSAAKPIGHINVWVKLTRKPSSGNPNAGFDVAGAGNVLRWFSGAPVPDPTGEKAMFWQGIYNIFEKNLKLF